MAVISTVFTIGYVANLLGEDEDWLFDLSIGMEPEDGSLWVYGVGEDGVPAFTRDGIDNLREIIAEERATGNIRPAKPPKQTALRCSPHAFDEVARLEGVSAGPLSVRSFGFCRGRGRCQQRGSRCARCATCFG